MGDIVPEMTLLQSKFCSSFPSANLPCSTSFVTFSQPNVYCNFTVDIYHHSNQLLKLANYSPRFAYLPNIENEPIPIVLCFDVKTVSNEELQLAIEKVKRKNTVVGMIAIIGNHKRNSSESRNQDEVINKEENQADKEDKIEKGNNKSRRRVRIVNCWKIKT